jgi:hypothetical protein
MNNTILKTLSFGLFVGIIDAILVSNLDPHWTYLNAITVITFWTILSLVINTSSFGGEASIKKGIMWSVILNLPWSTHFISIGMMEIIPLFIIVTFLYGAVLGWLNYRFNSKIQLNVISDEVTE